MPEEKFQGDLNTNFGNVKECLHCQFSIVVLIKEWLT